MSPFCVTSARVFKQGIFVWIVVLSVVFVVFLVVRWRFISLQLFNLYCFVEILSCGFFCVERERYSSCLCTSSLKISTLLTCLRFTTLLRFRQWRSEGPGGADSLVCVAVRRDGKNGGGEIYTTLRRKLTAQKIPKSTNKQQANN